VAQRPVFAPQFSSSAKKLTSLLKTEIEYETSNYEKPVIMQELTKSTDWKFSSEASDVNMYLEKEVSGGKKVVIDWQLLSPVLSDETEEGQEPPSTDFVVTISNNSGHGIAFYCSTQSGEEYRFIVGQVQQWETEEERDNDSSYRGPEFEDLDERMQESLSEYLAEIGVDDAVCDFIDCSATDKEQNEYVRWLKGVKAFME